MDSTIREDTIICRTGDWLSAQAGDELMMMSAREGLYLGLNRMGARIWELLEEGRDAESLCRQLVAEFDVEPGQCRQEVHAFLGDLMEHKAITLQQPG